MVCFALTGFGLSAGDDPAFDYVIQAATGIAAVTEDPHGPPTLPGYSSADNSTGPAAALGLLAHIVSGRGSQGKGSLRDVMPSRLNYRAAAHLNEGTEPRRVCTRISFRPNSFRLLTDTWQCSSPTMVLAIIRHRAWYRGLRPDGSADSESRWAAVRRGRGWPATPPRLWSSG